MYPNAGDIGPLKMEMYRGIRRASERLDSDFASDPGDYGAGEYWTDDAEFAANYGEVHRATIALDRVYHIPKAELLELIAEYRTCRMEDGHPKRRENALRLTKHFQSLGYEAVLTVGYEFFDVIGLCIFPANPAAPVAPNVVSID